MTGPGLILGAAKVVLGYLVVWRILLALADVAERITRRRAGYGLVRDEV